MEANFSGGCENPTFITLTAGRSVHQAPEGAQAISGRLWRQSALGDAWHVYEPPLLSGERERRYIDMVVPCRTACRACLRKRRHRYQSMMSRGMLYAIMRGGRAWFGSLTMAPGFRPRVEAEALAAMRTMHGAEVCWHSLPPFERDAFRSRAFNAYLVRWWDRIKKALPPEQRQSVHLYKVIEWHKDGFPHAHVVIVENDPETSLPHALLESEWRLVLPGKRAVRVTLNGVSRVYKDTAHRLGFTKFKLVETGEGTGEKAIRRSAAYVAKYLGKALSFFRGPLFAGLDHDERAALLVERRARVGRMPGVGSLFVVGRMKRERAAMAARCVADAQRAFGAARSSVRGRIARIVNAARELPDVSLFSSAWFSVAAVETRISAFLVPSVFSPVVEDDGLEASFDASPVARGPPAGDWCPF